MKSGKRPISKRPAWRNGAMILALILVLAGGAAAWYFYWGPGSVQAQSNTETGSQTYTETVKRGDLRVAASGSGKLVAYQSVDLSFSTSGTVAELNVKAGDMVKVGQQLASLGSSQTLNANLSAAKLQVLKAQKNLTDLQKNASLSLAQSYSDLVAAQDAYDAVQTKSERLAYARCSQNVATRLAAALDRATKQLEGIHAETTASDAYIAAKKAYDTALANYNECAPYTTDEKTAVQSALDVAKAALQQAQDQYDTLKSASGIDPAALAMGEAKLKEAQAQLARAQDQLAGITLTAPIDGKVTYLAASVGAKVDTSKFITIADVSHSIIEISVDESDIDKLVVGASVSVTFDALPGQSFTGKVVQVNPQMTTSMQYKIAKGQAELDTDSANTIAALPQGLSATVTLITKEAKNALLVPVIALKDLGDNTYAVMVQGSDGQLRMQTVTVGIKDNDYAEITSGLKEGDQVSTGTVKFVAAGSNNSSSSLKNAQNGGNDFPDMPPIP